MNRSSFALFVALLIHILLLIIFWFLGSMIHDIKKPVEPKKDIIKVSLMELPKKIIEKIPKIEKQKSVSKPKEKVVITKIPPMPKGKQLKKIVHPKVKSVEKPLIKYKKQKVEQKKVLPKIIKLKPKKLQEQKEKIKSVLPKKPYIKLPQKKKINKKYESYDWLLDDKSNQEVKKKKNTIVSKNSINNNIKELYGDIFGKLSLEQQKYILDNQEIMRRITQEVLTRVAKVNLTKNLNINRVNIIEFYLHPNGDISDFKYLKKSGYYILDITTKETIEFAYSRYPRTKVKTLIRYNVFYNLRY
ncbi:MAG: energy transducer TonB [Sulfurimonas sp.]|nr:energy transducer TonB [Sulfurimonas sp.]